MRPGRVTGDASTSCRHRAHDAGRAVASAAAGARTARARRRANAAGARRAAASACARRVSYGEPRFWRHVKRTPAALIHAHDARAHTWAVLAGAPPAGGLAPRGLPGEAPDSLSRLQVCARRAVPGGLELCRGRALVEAGVPAERVRVVYDGVEAPLGRTSIRAARSLSRPDFDDPRKGKRHIERDGLADVKYSSRPDGRSGRSKVFVYLTDEEGLGSAVFAGACGRRASGGQPRGRLAGDRAA